jgi:hypothetical protein
LLLRWVLGALKVAGVPEVVACLLLRWLPATPKLFGCQGKQHGRRLESEKEEKKDKKLEPHLCISTILF